jgi:hypothetical protein
MQNDRFKRGFLQILVAGEKNMSQVVCREFEWRRNIKYPGRTLYILIDTGTFEILEPTRIERSRTGAHGVDIYCQPKEKWDRIVVVGLYQSNSGKLSYEIRGSQQVKQELEELLMLARDFEDMVDIVHKYVRAKALVKEQ